MEKHTKVCGLVHSFVLSGAAKTPRTQILRNRFSQTIPDLVLFWTFIQVEHVNNRAKQVMLFIQSSIFVNINIFQYQYLSISILVNIKWIKMWDKPAKQIKVFKFCQECLVPFGFLRNLLSYLTLRTLTHCHPSNLGWYVCPASVL